MTKTPPRIAIVGAGAWGTCLANLATRNGLSVHLWSRRSGESLETVLAEADVLISAVAIAGVRGTIQQLQRLEFPSHLTIVTATKGLDPQTTQTPYQLWKQAFPQQAIAVLSGPNLSKEINQGLPAATVIAIKKPQMNAAKTVQYALNSDRFRVYLNNDPIGTELGGTLKNVVAIAAGVCDGLKLGNNAKAGLLTRALPEIVRVGACLGAAAETFFGLSGLGDLLATCNSPLSRNYQVGYRLSQGDALATALANIEGTAEGVNTTQVLLEIAKKQNLSVPIAYQVHRLLQGEITPQAAVKNLMERCPKGEFEDWID